MDITTIQINYRNFISLKINATELKYKNNSIKRNEISHPKKNYNEIII